MAACTLLTGTVADASLLGADDGGEAGNTYADIGALLYNEAGKRVSAKEGVFSIRHMGQNDSKFNLQLILDTLSGGSPNGALPSHSVQTFATPSGRTLTPTVSLPTIQTCTTASGMSYSCGGSSGQQNTVYKVAPGSLPLDQTFQDHRQALNLSYEWPVLAATRVSVGGAYSIEADFQSLALNGSVAQELNHKNTTLSLGADLEHDSNAPTGGTPVPLSNYALFARQADSGKDVDSLVLGITQILTRRWITQLDFSADSARGYLTDPYKIVSGLDSAGNLVGYIYENRPDTRSRRVIFWENRVALGKDMVDLSYRAERDDWGVVSGTADFHYRHMFGGGRFLEPHFRWYTQTAADFHRLYVVQDDPYLQVVSADPRLGAFTAQTIGLKYGYQMDADSVFSVSIERYRQHGVVDMPVLPQLQGLDLYPDLNATVIEANLQLRF